MSQPKFRVKRGDFVEVLVGKDKGSRGEVTRVFLKEARVLVKGVNVVKRHLKPSQKNPNGGIERKELPIHISNVSLIDPTTDLPGKVEYQIKDGQKVRVFKKTGTALSSER